MARDPVCGMEVDEDAGISLTWDGQTHVFCSRGCLETFAEENGIPEEDLPGQEEGGEAPWYKNKVVIVSSVLAALILGSTVFPLLVPFRTAFLTYLQTIWWAIL